MTSADLILYPTGGEPTRLVQLDYDNCVRFLLPFIQSCRESHIDSQTVAEIDFQNGSVAWFSSFEGVVDLRWETPRFGNTRKWFGIIPAPMVQHVRQGTDDDQIKSFMRPLFEAAGGE